MKWGARIFGGLAGVLLVYLLVGLLLPGTWEAEVTGVVDAPPAAVFPFINGMTRWAEWTPFPETGLENFGPREGPGAGIRWDDPRYGKGEAEILDSLRDREVVYRVRIEDGALIIRGTLTLTPEDGNTRVQWKEEGDFGWNPLMGYAARGMASSQADAMRASLERLREAAASRGGSDGG